MRELNIKSGFIGLASRLVQRRIRVGIFGLAVMSATVFMLPAIASNGEIKKFHPSIYDKSFPDVGYGENVRQNTNKGTTSLETSDGNGHSFFVYVSANPGLHYDPELSMFHTWSIQGIGFYFPAGFDVTIKPIPADGRPSKEFGKVTEQAPDYLFLLAKNNDSLELAWKAEPPKINKTSIVGWEITITNSASVNNAEIKSFLPYIRGRNHTFIEYGGAAMCNARNGTTRLETSGGKGNNFFIYVADNVNSDTEPNLIRFHTWTIKGLEKYFPAGFDVKITSIPIGGRSSETIGDVTAKAPDYFLIKSVDKDSFTMDWKKKSYNFPRSTVFGWEVVVTAK